MVDRETLIQDIYEAAALPEQWPRVLEQIGSTVGTRHAVMGTRRSDAWTGWTACLVPTVLPICSRTLGHCSGRAAAS